MSMDSYACGGYVIDYKNLKKLCPAEIKSIESTQYWDYVGWRSLARGINFSDPDTIVESLEDSGDTFTTKERQALAQAYVKLVKNLCAAFKKRTGGLTLYLNDYSDEDGSSYDEVDEHEGCIFVVGGMVQLTPAGKRFQKVIEQQRWTQFG